MREECYITDAFFIVQRADAQGEGYSVSLALPTLVEQRQCETIKTSVRNCINVLPGRSHAYVEAALGIEAPEPQNNYRWHDQTATLTETTKLTLIFDGATLATIKVFTMKSSLLK